MGANFRKHENGEDDLGVKALILYATSHGATKVCAEKLAEALGGQADVAAVKHFSGGTPPYDCVIVGSPVYGGSVLKEVKEYCRENSAQLARKPFAVFFSCLSESEAAVRGYLERNFPPELAGAALACASFGGAFYFSRLNFLERAIDRGLAKAYAKSSGTAAPDGIGDFVTISNEKIAAFAAKIREAVEASA